MYIRRPVGQVIAALHLHQITSLRVVPAVFEAGATPTCMYNVLRNNTHKPALAIDVKSESDELDPNMDGIMVKGKGKWIGEAVA